MKLLGVIKALLGKYKCLLGMTIKTFFSSFPPAPFPLSLDIKFIANANIVNSTSSKRYLLNVS